ncbi:Serine/threonine-protein kinase PknB [Planctomycetes bacterium CA13]|uniref:Serine/threonine-protein kinase PknB n=1 Tax=Novipirellula herctigrandis TaxID=2527986 RepID=A0A5C5YN45_9BACT|nr:Serine/threonine-protein kinase PknB [Planctomycetes bacterium CA13]
MASSDLKTTLSFKEAAQRSGLVSSQKWNHAVQTAGSEDDDLVAEALVQSGDITEYQSAQLRGGRTKFNLGPYLITGWIGQGGMGQVFKAVHSVMGRECAVKTLPLEKLTKQSRAAFVREIRLQAGLDSPYVVRAYDAGQDGSVHYLVTEYVPGTDLRRLVRSGGPLTMNHAALVISQAAMGLQYAHDLSLVHRDVKPGNILVTPEGHAKVSDIGLAGYSFGGKDDPRAGKIVGTADYLSPEQIRHPSSVDPLSDIYSLGCTLYYVVTGKVPFPGGDAKSKCKRHCEQTPWHPRKFIPELSEDFVDVIADMMEKDPSKRIQSASEVVERLEPWSMTALEFVDRPIDRRPWMPPPPPKEPAPPREYYRDSGSDHSESAHSSELSHSDARSGAMAIPSVPGSMSNSSSDFKTAARPSLLVPIALTLALAVPLSLLAGAIIGVLLHDKF